MSDQSWLPIATALVALRAATQEPTSMSVALDEADAALSEAVGNQASLNLTEAAHLLGVSTNTLKVWTAKGHLPLETFRGYKRPRISARRVIPIAVEMEKLRRSGRRRRLLPDALAAINQ